MRRLLWLGIVFISASFLYFIPIFTVPDWRLGLLFIFIGTIFNIVAFRKERISQINTKYLIFSLPLILSLFVISYPYNIGLLILTIALLLFIFMNKLKFKKTDGIIIGISFTGILMSLQTALLPFYSIFVSHGHRIDIISPIISIIGNPLGLSTSVNNGIVFVQTFQQTYPFVTTWEKFGFFSWFNICIGAFLVLILFYKKSKLIKNACIFLIASFLYLLLRYIFFIHLFITTLELNIFWNPLFTFLSFLLLSVFLIKIIPLDDIKSNRVIFKNYKIQKRHLIASIMFFIFIFSIAGALAFQDPGITKNGRILIDEYHSDWEDTIRPLDKEWYGMLSTYNYYSWAEWLNKYYIVVRNNETITSNILEKYDILILKCPTNSYSNEELWAIVQFVERGGGLYLIGDHTDVFGMNTYLNQIAEHFGIRFKTDATYELGTGMMSVYKPDTILSHPIVQHLHKFNFMTSCSLSAPLTSENVIIGKRLISEPGTYSTENFFRESVSSPESEYGLLLQVVAVKYGKGRVLAFSDSTVFSSFSMFSDGYKKFNFGAIEYLNRMNQYPYVNTILIGLSIISIIITFYLLKNERKLIVLLLLLFAGLLSLSTAVPLVSYFNNIHYSFPEEHSDFFQVCFEQEYSDFNISLQPSIGFFNEQNNFGTFFVWTQRIDCYPSIKKTLDKALEQGDIIVFINPIKSFKTPKIKAITNYLENGGRILIMDSISNSHSTANELIGNFGMWINYNSLNQRVYLSNNGSRNNMSVGNITFPYLSITGGEKFFLNNNNQTYASVVEFINESTAKIGKVVVFVDSYSFSDSVMGGTFNEPDENQMEIYNTEFYIFEQILLNDA
jgi:hypothetical protein